MTGSILNNLKLEKEMFTSKTKISARVKNLRLSTTEWGNACRSCLFGDFNVYGSRLCSNICLSHIITLTDIIAQIEAVLKI